MNHYPNLSLTLLLAFTLITPFALKTLKPHLEPYPAIILPSGASKADVGAREISFNRISLWSKHEQDNTWTRVDLETFLAPIPLGYFIPIVKKSSFGLKSAQRRIIKPEVQNAKHWWREKLVQSGYASDELMINFERVKFDLETGKIIRIKMHDEEIIGLD